MKYLLSFEVVRVWLEKENDFLFLILFVVLSKVLNVSCCRVLFILIFVIFYFWRLFRVNGVLVSFMIIFIGRFMEEMIVWIFFFVCNFGVYRIFVFVF